ncbi:hypothetical protein BT69DRAFT_1319695 [Atractiella rhizophila]|nr:hypothetical protein BT69DRAFT_1319695 [Atractiella rhizophila]
MSQPVASTSYLPPPPSQTAAPNQNLSLPSASTTAEGTPIPRFTPPPNRPRASSPPPLLPRQRRRRTLRSLRRLRRRPCKDELDAFLSSSNANGPDATQGGRGGGGTGMRIEASDPYLSTLLSHPLPTLLSLPTTLKSSLSTLSTSLSSLSHKSYSVFLRAHESADKLDSGLDALRRSAEQVRGKTVEDLRDGVRRFVGSSLPHEKERKGKGREASQEEDDVAVAAQREGEEGEGEEGMEQILRERDQLVNLNSSLLPKVLDLISLPSHVSNCVRTNQWTEALELFDLLKRLLNTYSSSGQGGGSGEKLLGSLYAQTKIEILGLRSLVVATLRERGLKLPSAVRCVGLLRRMEAVDEFSSNDPNTAPTSLLSPPLSSFPSFSSLSSLPSSSSGEEMEKQLRLIFLLARLSCLHDQVGQIDSQLEHLGVLGGGAGGSAGIGGEGGVEVENEERVKGTKRWIEVWREVVGEACGMFLGIFPPNPNSAPTDSSEENHSFSLPPSPSPLPHFLSHTLSLLHLHLSTNLVHLSSASTLSSLLTQLSYCSDSFSRYGFAFKSLLSPLLIDRLREVLTTRMREGGRTFVDTLRLKREEGVRRQLWRRHSRMGSKVYNYESYDLKARHQLQDWLIAPDSLDKLLALSSNQLPGKESLKDGFTHLPPPLLSLFPPLAKLVNSQAAALNELRLLPAIALKSQIEIIQKEILREAAEEISKFWNGEVGDGRSSDAVGAKEDGWKQEEEEEGGDEEERREMMEDKKRKRRIVYIFLSLYARTVVPWCLSALRTGIYNERPSSGWEGWKEVTEGCEEILAREEGTTEKKGSNGLPVTNGSHGNGILEGKEEKEAAKADAAKAELKSKYLKKMEALKEAGRVSHVA